jgi:hypothetical protein
MKMPRLTIAFVWLLVVTIAGCVPGMGNLVAPEEYGLTDNVDELANRFEEFDVYASSDRATTTALVFDQRGDGWTIRPQRSFWIPVESRYELDDRIAEMRWAYGQANRLRAIRTPDGQAAAGMVYSPAIVGTRVEEPEVVISGVSLSDACRMVPFQFGSGPCLKDRDRR